MLYVAGVPTCVACDELQRVEAKGEPLPEQQRKHHEARVLDLDDGQITWTTGRSPVRGMSEKDQNPGDRRAS
jgi:hypothetical protein